MRLPLEQVLSQPTMIAGIWASKGQIELAVESYANQSLVQGVARTVLWNPQSGRLNIVGPFQGLPRRPATAFRLLLGSRSTARPQLMEG